MKNCTIGIGNGIYMALLNHSIVNFLPKATAHKKQIRCIVNRFIGSEFSVNPSLVSVVVAHSNCKPIVKKWQLLLVGKRFTSNYE